MTMIAPDVNVLLPVLISSAPNHASLLQWFEGLIADRQLVGLSDLVLSGVVRVTTRPGIFNPPANLPALLTQLDHILAQPTVERISPGRRHWTIFRQLCLDTGATGKLVADAQHAAIAIEHDAIWISFDSDFARFNSLDWQTPNL